MSKVVCLRCKTTYEVPFSHLLFSPLHFILWHYIKCPNCGGHTWHRHLVV